MGMSGLPDMHTLGLQGVHIRQTTCALVTRPESIMLQNMPIMLSNFLPICLFLCFLDMDYADNSYI